MNSGSGASDWWCARRKYDSAEHEEASQGLWTGALGHRAGVGFCSSPGLLILPCHPEPTQFSTKLAEWEGQRSQQAEGISNKAFLRPPGFCVPRSNAPYWPWRAPAFMYTYTPTHIHVHILKNSKNKSLKRRKGKQPKLKDPNIHFCKDGL